MTLVAGVLFVGLVVLGARYVGPSFYGRWGVTLLCWIWAAVFHVVFLVDLPSRQLLGLDLLALGVFVLLLLGWIFEDPAHEEDLQRSSAG